MFGQNQVFKFKCPYFKNKQIKQIRYFFNFIAFSFDIYILGQTNGMEKILMTLSRMPGMLKVRRKEKIKKT